MKGPHGLNNIQLTQLEHPHHPTPFRVYVDRISKEEGLSYSLLVVKRHESYYATATCCHVEGDDATLKAAKQWLLDLVNARYG